MAETEKNGDLESLQSVDIILASTAAWRSDILTQFGIPHRCIDPTYVEPRSHDGDLREFVRETAIRKARSIKDLFPSSLIISADQLVQIHGETLFKPGNKENAVSQLQKLAGKQHHLLCAVAVLYRSLEESDIEQATLKMRQLTHKEINNYVERDDPVNCAGSYKIESLGASLFEEINATDPTTVIGLPGSLLITILRQMGFSNLL